MVRGVTRHAPFECTQEVVGVGVEPLRSARGEPPTVVHEPRRQRPMEVPVSVERCAEFEFPELGCGEVADGCQETKPPVESGRFVVDAEIVIGHHIDM